MDILKIETCFSQNYYLKESTSNFSLDSQEVENNLIVIYPNLEYQEFHGFGGAFTEATCYNLTKCSKSLQNQILEEYFGTSGIGYTLCRTHINSCDFALGNYHYLKTKNLSSFSIEHDKKYLIPVIRKALEKTQNLKLLASPWSPPGFMKSNNQMNQGGTLLDSYKQMWADYLVCYVKEYQKQEIPISYLTIQNEPLAKQPWESCLYSAEEEKDFLENYLYPAFQQSSIDTKIFIWDHNKERIFQRASSIITTDKQYQMVAGVAYHYYSGDHFENLLLTRQFFPDQLLFHTEGCVGYSHFRKEDEVQNAEIYAHDIIGDLNGGSNGYIDWNLVLNYSGGPNHKNNFCNSPIMLNQDYTGYTKNLSFYYIAHFSKYITPGSKRIAFSRYTDQIELTAFKNNTHIILVLLNKKENTLPFNLYLANDILTDEIKPHSILTYQIPLEKY